MQPDLFEAAGITAPLPRYRVYTSSQYRNQCGYCGRNTTHGAGNGGGCGTLPDGLWVMWEYCSACYAKHGRPDPATHPNLEVIS